MSKMANTEKCKGCEKDFEHWSISNYVVKYESWEAFNCCSKECAKKAAIRDGIEETEITSIE